MEVALTFGSLGDIIAVCQLAIKLGRAIGESQYGSAKEYQGLRNELDMFVKVLMQVRLASTSLNTRVSRLTAGYTYTRSSQHIRNTRLHRTWPDWTAPQKRS